MSPVTIQEIDSACILERGYDIKTYKQAIKKTIAENKKPTRRYIYFVASESGHIKIGSANNVKSRMGIMHTDCPFKIKLIGKIKVGEFTENAIHKRFAHIRYRGEWFLDTAEIREFIKIHKMHARKRVP